MSKTIPAWSATIQNGQMVIKNVDRFKEYCLCLTGELEVIVRKVRRKRSADQNGYYWGVVIRIYSDFFGHPEEEKEIVHEMLLAEYSRQISGPRVKGSPPPRMLHSSAMTTVEFEDYMSWCRRWGAMEYGLNIPEPNEAIY